VVASLEADVKPEGANQGDVVRVLQNMRDAINALLTFAAGINDTLQGNYVIGVPALTLGSNKDDIATAAFTYMIGGKQYSKAAVTAGTAPGNDVVPEGLYGAVALDIGADGTLDAIEASANATGYVSAALAVAALPASAAGHARVGWVTATSAAGAFTFGTTEFDAADTTVAFTDAPTLANSLADPSIVTAITLNKG
jgi:hypothetical protein